MTTRPNLSGAERLPESFWRAFVAMCDRHGWNRDAIAAVMHVESGFRPDAGLESWAPSRTASGLIQFIESTARGLGVEPTDQSPDARTRQVGGGRPWATWRILSLPAETQLEYVEAYYERAGANVSWRPVDYYVAGWGERAGLPLDEILAMEGENVYAVNKGLDFNADGRITVQDLAQHVARHTPSAWVDVTSYAPSNSPLPSESSAARSDGRGLSAVLLGLAFSGLVTYGLFLLRRLRHGG